MQTRLATPEDAPAIAAIYNQGIEDRIATFETRPRSADDVRTWFRDKAHPIVVVTENLKTQESFQQDVSTWLQVAGCKLQVEGPWEPGLI